MNQENNSKIMTLVTQDIWRPAENKNPKITPKSVKNTYPSGRTY